MKEQIRKLRVEIDGLAQLCEGLKPIKDGYLIHKAVGHLGTIPVYGTTEEQLKERQRKYEEEYEKADAKTSKNTEEIKEAVKSLKLSKAWLGKVLESLGSENPYGSGYKTVEDIIPATDKAAELNVKQHLFDSLVSEGEIKQSWSEKSHIEKVDWLRTEIVNILRSMEDVAACKAGAIAYDHLQEARFWLGFEMGRIRDESK